MVTIAFPKEAVDGEKRCAVMPNNVKQYVSKGFNVLIQSGLANNIGLTDEDFVLAGATVKTDFESVIEQADIIATFNPVPIGFHSQLKARKPKLISFLDPFNNRAYLSSLRDNDITSISVEMIPRSSRCQKMDALSSQASLAGYVMVVQALNKLQSIAPMMMTPSGTIKPAKVFIIGAGVAGLQAIATAKRLGAQVTAFDTRPIVAEQVESLGGKFLKMDLGDTGQTEQGYANELTPEQLAIQQEAQEACIVDSDIVITTAQLFGRKPPLLIQKSTITKMKPGSVIVDMAAENGGNVEGSVFGKVVTINGVHIIGHGNWPNFVAKDASQMFGNNVQNFIFEFWSDESQTLNFDLNNEILASCVITHDGELVSNIIKKHLHAEA